MLHCLQKYKLKCRTNRTKTLQENRDEASVSTGDCIVNIQTLAKNLIYIHCNQRLGLDKIYKKTRKGLDSVFMIECDVCKQVIRVDT